MTFAEGLPKSLIGKMVEIYLGDDHRVHLKSEHTIPKKSVIYGELISINNSCLEVKVTVNGASNIVYINAWAVETLISPQNGISTYHVYVEDERKERRM